MSVLSSGLSFSPALSRSLSLSCAHSLAIYLGVGDGHAGARWDFIEEVCPRSNQHSALNTGHADRSLPQGATDDHMWQCEQNVWCDLKQT